jgi:hypothetical protein
MSEALSDSPLQHGLGGGDLISKQDGKSLPPTNALHRQVMYDVSAQDDWLKQVNVD